MRRRSPRPLVLALTPVAEAVAPLTTLARVQASWHEAVGSAVAAEGVPVRERDGVVWVRCSSSVWAHELDLLSPELLRGLEAALGPGRGGVRSLRFVTGTPDPGETRE